MRNKIKMFCVGGVAVAALAATSQPASAGVFLSLTSDAGPTVSCNTVTLAGCGAPVFSPFTNVITFNGTVGFFTTLGTLAAANVPGSATLAQLNSTNLVVTNNDTATHTLTIDVTGFDFTFPPNPASSSPMKLSGSQSLTTATVTTGGSVKVQSFADATNAISSGANPNTPCTIAITPSNNCDESSISWARDAGPFSLRTLVTLTLGAGQIVQLTSSTAATALPEPTSLLLLGSGLLVVGRKLRKRVKNSETASV